LTCYLTLSDYLLKNGKNRLTGKIRDTELIDQFIQVDTLPEKDRQILKALLEAFLKNTALRNWQ